jgi:glycosyltransferase involved in cell wall biosynthesis
MEEQAVISIVIPAYNVEDTIGPCLEAVLAQTIAHQTEVIVVDDGSTDGTSAVVQQYAEVELLRQTHQGPAAARNHGAAEARGQVVLFTDADCEPLPDWAVHLSRPLLNCEAVGAKGTYRTRQRSLVARFVQQEYEEKYARMARKQEIDFVDTYSAGYNRQVFLTHGAFDATFSTASVEDQDLSFRLACQGYRMVFVPQAVVFHRHANTLAKYTRKKLRIGYWKPLVIRKHPRKMLRDSHTPESQKLQFVAPPLLILAALLACFWSPGRWFLGFLAVGYALSMLPLLMRVLWRDPPVLAVAPLLILVRALALGAGFAWGILRFWIVRRRVC